MVNNCPLIRRGMASAVVVGATGAVGERVPPASAIRNAAAVVSRYQDQLCVWERIPLQGRKSFRSCCPAANGPKSQLWVSAVASCLTSDCCGHTCRRRNTTGWSGIGHSELAHITVQLRRLTLPMLHAGRREFELPQQAGAAKLQQVSSGVLPCQAAAT